MSDVSPPRRRWFRFSLKTLFVVLTLFGVWLGVQVNWIRQRREARQWIKDHGGLIEVDTEHNPIGAPLWPRPRSLGYPTLRRRRRVKDMA